MGGGRNTPRQYPRSARVNEVVQQVLAEELDLVTTAQYDALVQAWNDAWGTP